MDPNANINEQRALCESILAASEAGIASDPTEVTRLAELVHALDEWIVNGGFLPTSWNR